MTIGEGIKVTMVMVTLIGVPSLMVTGVVRGILRRRGDRRDLSRRVHEAIEKITADGKEEGPKGKFVWRNWSRKWVNYTNAFTALSQKYLHYLFPKLQNHNNSIETTNYEIVVADFVLSDSLVHQKDEN